MVAARNSDSNCKNHDERNRGHKDHNLESQTKANARHDARKLLPGLGHETQGTCALTEKHWDVGGQCPPPLVRWEIDLPPCRSDQDKPNAVQPEKETIGLAAFVELRW